MGRKSFKQPHFVTEACNLSESILIFVERLRTRLFNIYWILWQNHFKVRVTCSQNVVGSSSQLSHTCPLLKMSAATEQQLAWPQCTKSSGQVVPSINCRAAVWGKNIFSSCLWVLEQLLFLKQGQCCTMFGDFVPNTVSFLFLQKVLCCYISSYMVAICSTN